MSIFTPNNIQTGVTSSYTDEYLKEALANLGQRKGIKGDGLLNSNISISDLYNEVQDYLQLEFSSENNTVKFYADGITHLRYVDVSNKVFKDQFTITENINNNIDLFSNLNIIFNKDINTYFAYFKGIGNGSTEEGDKIVEVNVIQIDNDNNTIVGTAFILNNNINFCFYSTNEELIYNYIIDSSVLDLNVIYNIISECNSIIEIKEKLGLIESPEVDESEDYHFTNLKLYANVLPFYIKNIYSTEKYFLNENDFIFGLKNYILANICTKLYEYAINNSVESVQLLFNRSYIIKIPKNFKIEYVLNDRTQLPYISYNFYSLFTNIDNFNVNKNNNFIISDFETPDNASNRLIALQFINNGDNENTYINRIDTNIIFEYPYIDKSEGVSYDTWFINGEDTQIRVVGKDAGIPNILVVSFTDNSPSKDESASTDSSNITVNIEHSYVDEDINYSEVLNLFLAEDTVESTFFYALDTDNTVGISNVPLYKFKINLPNPEKIISDDRYKKLFSNSLMMLLVDMKISDTIINGLTLQETMYGSKEDTSDRTSYITLYYHLTENNGIYTWEPIKNPAFNNIENKTNQPVLDFTTLAGIKDIIPYVVRYNVEPDKYLHEFLVFDSVANAYKQSDQQIDNYISKYYPVIKTDPAEYYDEDGEYNNELQFVPKFIDEESIIMNTGYKISEIRDNPNLPDKPDYLFSINSGSVNNPNTISGVWMDKNDFIPSSNVDAYPIFDFREVLGNNLSILNRLSIIGLDKNGKTFHAYLGVSSDIENKNIIKLSSDVISTNLRHNKTITDDYYNLGAFDKFVDEIPTEFSKTTEFNDTATFNKPVVFNDSINNIIRFKVNDNKILVKCLIYIGIDDPNIKDTQVDIHSKYLPLIKKHKLEYNIQGILQNFFDIDSNEYYVTLYNMNNLPKTEFNGIREIIIELNKNESSYTIESAYENIINISYLE